MIEVKNIYCGYENKKIIKDLSFNVNNGENLCIVGPNGCGKSTLLKSIANIIEYEGSIKIDNKEIQQEKIPEIIYIAKNTDTLGKIAKNNNMSIKEILDINPQIKNPDRIYPG